MNTIERFSEESRQMADEFARMLWRKKLAKSWEQARLNGMLLNSLLFRRPEQAKRVLAAGADPNSRFPRGTALGLAIHHERLGVVRALLDAGADPNLRSNGKPPLTLACEHGMKPFIELLLERGASVQALGEFRNTALLDAAACGCLPLARKLLKAGVPIDFRGKHGSGGTYGSMALPRGFQTSLMLAAFYGERQMVQFLIESGGDVNLKDGKGHTAIDYARLLKLPNYSRVVKLLEAARAVAAKPFAEPVSRIPDFTEPAKSARFQKALAKLSRLTGNKPLPLHQLEGPVPGGFGFPLGEERAWKIVKEHHRSFLQEGSYLFFTRDLIQKNGPAVALLPTTDLGKVVRAVGTEGPDDNMYNEQVVAWLTRLKQEQPVEMLGLGHDFVEGFFTAPVKGADGLARKIAKICSELGDEPAALRAEAARLKKDKRLFLWWD